MAGGCGDGAHLARKCSIPTLAHRTLETEGDPSVGDLYRCYGVGSPGVLVSVTPPPYP